MTETPQAFSHSSITWTAFRGARLWATGQPQDVARRAGIAVREGSSGTLEESPLLVFEDSSGRVVDLDLRGTLEEVEARYFPKEASLAAFETESAAAQPAAERKPGRPKLGVVAREVTLLPRHWDWLNEQPGGASVILRKLVETAKNAGTAAALRRRSAEAAYRFMTAMAGDLHGYEETIRALYADDLAAFQERIQSWPDDVRDYAEKLAAGAFSERSETLVKG